MKNKIKPLKILDFSNRNFYIFNIKRNIIKSKNVKKYNIVNKKCRKLWSNESGFMRIKKFFKKVSKNLT